MKQYKHTVFTKAGKKFIMYGFSIPDVYDKLNKEEIDLIVKGDYENSNKYIYLSDKETWVTNLFN